MSSGSVMVARQSRCRNVSHRAPQLTCGVGGAGRRRDTQCILDSKKQLRIERFMGMGHTTSKNRADHICLQCRPDVNGHGQIMLEVEEPGNLSGP